MGGGASAGVQAAVAAASVEDLKATLAELTPEGKAKLAASLPQRLRQVQGDVSRSCVARVQAALDAISAQNGRLNACCEVLAESALKQAAEADAKLTGGAARRVLEGVPILVKVNIDVAGTLSTGSMPGLADWRPESTAPVVAKLLEAGAIPVAKTNMCEAAIGNWGFSPVHGITKNAINSRYTTAGSSSGTASGVAAGLAPCGLGSDTEGSQRMPAESCGVVGLRPSLGRYPSSGIVPCDVAHDTPGPMAKTVADVAVLDAVIMGEPLADYAPAELKGLAVAVPGDLSSAACPGHRRALDLAMAALSKAGASCKTEGLDFRPLSRFQHAKSLDFREVGLEEYLASHPGCKHTVDEVLEKSFYPFIKSFFKEPKDVEATPLVNIKTIPPEEAKALKEKFDAELREWEALYAKYFTDNSVDLVLTPCTNGPPPPLLTKEEYADVKTTFSRYMPQFRGGSSPLLLLNGLRIPSLAMPTAAKHEGLDGPPMPAGILLWGKPQEDKQLIQLALALEAALRG